MMEAEQRIKLITKYQTGNLFDKQSTSLLSTNGFSGYNSSINYNNAEELRQSSLDFNALLDQPSSAANTKPAIAQATNQGTSESNFFNKIEYASFSGANKRRKRPNRGYQTTETGSHLSPEISEEAHSRKTDSGSSCADEK